MTGNLRDATSIGDSTLSSVTAIEDGPDIQKLMESEKASVGDGDNSDMEGEGGIIMQELKDAVTESARE